MSRPIWFVNLLKWAFPSRHAMARMTHVPLIGRVVDHWIFRGDEMYMLPIDQTIQVHEDINQPQSMVIPSQVVDHYIKKANHRWIMDFCICRDGDKCGDYPRDLGCLFLGEPVMDINSKMGRMVNEDEALEHARKCREAGLVHIIGSNRIDSIWLGVHPTEELMTICNCCPCCCLWTFVKDLNPMIGEKLAIMPGVKVVITDDCTSCGTCQEGICFADAIHSLNGKSEITAACRGCGRCVEICPEDAIELSIEGEKNIADVIERLEALVDLK